LLHRIIDHWGNNYRGVVVVSDPEQVSDFNVELTYQTNTPTITWMSPNQGMAEEYVLTFIPTRGSITFVNATSNTMLEVNLQNGEQYRIEIVVVFQQLHSTPISAVTVIGNVIRVIIF